MAFREGGHSCPACSATLVHRGSVLACNGCGGAWLGEDDVLERARIVRGKAELELSLAFAPPRMEPSKRRVCPICQAGLSTLSLGGVDVDRCGARHGIWFDAKELQAALMAASEGGGVINGSVPLERNDGDVFPNDADLLDVVAGLLKS